MRTPSTLKEYSDTNTQTRQTERSFTESKYSLPQHIFRKRNFVVLPHRRRLNCVFSGSLEQQQLRVQEKLKQLRRTFYSLFLLMYFALKKQKTIAVCRCSLNKLNLKKLRLKSVKQKTIAVLSGHNFIPSLTIILLPQILPTLSQLN